MVYWNLCATRAQSTWISCSHEAANCRERRREERSGNCWVEWVGRGYQRDKGQRRNTRCACSQCTLFLEYQQTTKLLFHPYWLFKCQCLCSYQVVPINYSVTQLYHVPKKGRGKTELNRIKTQQELFDFKKEHVLCKESATFSLETPSGEGKGKVSQQYCWIRANTVEQQVSAEPAVCSESLWDKSETLRMLRPSLLHIAPNLD